MRGARARGLCGAIGAAGKGVRWVGVAVGGGEVVADELGLCAGGLSERDGEAATQNIRRGAAGCVHFDAAIVEADAHAVAEVAVESGVPDDDREASVQRVGLFGGCRVGGGRGRGRGCDDRGGGGDVCRGRMARWERVGAVRASRSPSRWGSGEDREIRSRRGGGWCQWIRIVRLGSLWGLLWFGFEAYDVSTGHTFAMGPWPVAETA